MNGLDTSTAILLHRAGILRLSAESLDLIITEQVSAELSRGAEAPEAYAFLQIRPSLPDGPFDSGENSLLHLYEKGEIDIVFSDDGEFLRYCRKQDIPHCDALMVPWLLFQKKALSRDKALRIFRNIQELGRYSEEIVRIAEGYWGTD